MRTKPAYKALVIDSEKREVREALIPQETSLEGLQAIVKGYIELVRLDRGADLFVNEEGMYQGFTTGFIWHGFDTPLLGNGVICGHTPSGDSADAPLTLAEVKARVKFFTVPGEHEAAKAMAKVAKAVRRA